MIKDGYMYGYLFGTKQRKILDTGPEEIPLPELLEVWDGTQFVEIKRDEISYPSMIGTRARIKIT